MRHRFDRGRVERAQGIDILEDRAQIVRHRRDFRIGEAQAREQRKLANLLGGAKAANGRLVRISDDGYYEVTLALQGGSYTTLLPIASTVIIATQPESSVASIEVER